MFNFKIKYNIYFFNKICFYIIIIYLPINKEIDNNNFKIFKDPKNFIFPNGNYYIF